MGSYRARDLVRVPGLLSLARIPLGAVFPFAARDPRAALAVLVAAALTDVADGWYARRFGQVTPTGAAIDPITDKIFVLAVVVSLIVDGHLPLIAAPLLAARELGELPLILWVAGSRHARRARATHAMANAPGKIATVLQFITVGAALFHSRWMPLLLGWSAAMGVAAAASYWRRELALRARPLGPA